MNEKICGYELDREQKEIVLEDTKHLLVVAGAGSGKTLTILGKIYYLVERKNIDPKDILCISFTKASADSLKNKIEKEFSYQIPVYTFHKLSLEILKNNNYEYEITEADTLDNIIHEFFLLTILNYNNYMKIILEYFDIKELSNIKKNYLAFYNSNYHQLELLERLISTFIHLFKCNNHELKDYQIFLKNIKKTIFYKKYKKEKIFLIITLNIYLLYQEYLRVNNEIDFDDMIIKATNIVEKSNITKYKYIIIDEYQDTSYVKFCLIKEILNKTDANLMVVGDDFQSIYRFTGCELSLFINFNKYFPDSKIMKIENTYRNSEELIKVAGGFIMKNKNQIPKNLHSSKHLSNPIELIYYDNIRTTFKELISKINTPILVLGRNNKDINILVDDGLILKNNRLISRNNPNIIINYMTAHKSKGLEEENVVIINLENSFLGFPNKMKNDHILRLVSSSHDKYLYSEERRLFYVALTRTKNKVYLLIPKKRASIFIREVKKLIKTSIF